MSAASAKTPRQVVERRREGEQELRVAPPAAAPPHGHRRLAARQEHAGRARRLPPAARLAGNPGVHEGRLARLALDRVAENERLEAGLARHPRRRLERPLGIRDDLHGAAGKARIARLRGLRLPPLPPRRDGVGNRHAVTLGHLAGVRHRRWVRDGRAGGDGRGIVAGNVRKEHRVAPRGMARRGEPTALDPGKVLADRVHLGDVRTAREQRSVDGLLVVERHPGGGRREQRRTTPRDEAEQQVLAPEPCGEREDAFGRLSSRRVGDRMGRLDHLDVTAVHPMPVAGDHDPFRGRVTARAPGALDGASHGGRRLARAHHHRAPPGRLGEGGRNAGIGPHRVHRGGEHAPQQALGILTRGARGAVRTLRSLRRARPAGPRSRGGGLRLHLAAEGGRTRVSCGARRGDSIRRAGAAGDSAGR